MSKHEVTHVGIGLFIVCKPKEKVYTNFYFVGFCECGRFIYAHGAFLFLKHILNVFRIMEVEIMSSCGSFGNSFALIIVLFILLIIIGATCFGKGFSGGC
ncbi:YjcZ family sporulation protein [Priestia megaterium]|uniref:YjcZ family sporulation protein n=1 Tax=Priestia megaterium TaxID=1404 RepID=UPI002E1E9379|nr:YjcZ family sporulation protein [Priestia megaterium]